MVSRSEEAKRSVPRGRGRGDEPLSVLAELEPILHDTLHLYRGLAREDYRVWNKAGGDPVTEVDIQLDRYLKHRLLDRWPGYGWLSEESLDDRRRLGKRRTWIVDPLDGTRQFVAGIPEFACSIGLEEGGRIVVGAVLMLATGERYTAALGQGAYRNGRRLRVAESVTEASVLVSRRETEEGRFAELAEQHREELRFEPMGGMACKLVGVASGRGAGTFTAEPRYEWDVAGGALIVEEAGGLVTDGRGLPLSFNTSYARHAGVVASSPAIHDRLLALVQEDGGVS